VAGIDLRGQNLVVAGGQFVNNGFVVDSSNGGNGTATIIADYGALVKGAGFFQNPVITQNGGRVQAGNSPGKATYGSLTIGPGGIQNFGWQINDAGPSLSFPNAPGVPGPSQNANNLVSGWSQLAANQVFNPVTHTTSTGNLVWTATSTPGQQFQISMETLLGQYTTVGSSPDGPMSDFDPQQVYSWPVLSYQGSFSGPTDSQTLTADTLLDTSMFANPVFSYFGPFYIVLDQADKQVDLIYTPIPEPGTLGLVAIGLLGVWRASRRRRR
jgi:hypothetical protein